MTDQAIPADPAPGAAMRSPMRTFLHLASGFWRGDNARRAFFLTAVVAAFAASVVAAQYGMNRWQKTFFDALEKKNLDAVWSAVTLLPFLVAMLAIAMSGHIVSRMWFQMRWREWLTHRLAGWWIADQRYYRMSIVAREHTAPEFRIA